MPSPTGAAGSSWNPGASAGHLGGDLVELLLPAECGRIQVKPGNRSLVEGGFLRPGRCLFELGGRYPR